MSHTYKVALIHPSEKRVVLTNGVGLNHIWHFPGGKTDKDQSILAHLRETCGWKLESLGIQIPESLTFMRNLTVTHSHGIVNVGLYVAPLPPEAYILSAQNAAFLTREQILDRSRAVYPLTQRIADALMQEGRI